MVWGIHSKLSKLKKLGERNKVLDFRPENQFVMISNRDMKKEGQWFVIKAGPTHQNICYPDLGCASFGISKLVILNYELPNAVPIPNKPYKVWPLV